MADTIIEAIQAYLVEYINMPANAPVWINRLEQDVNHFAIIPIPGNKIVESYLDGSSLKEYNFAIQRVDATAEDYARIATSGFFEELEDWIESQSNQGILPVLPTGKTADTMRVRSSHYLKENAESERGVYEVLCTLTYDQESLPLI